MQDPPDRQKNYLHIISDT